MVHENIKFRAQHTQPNPLEVTYWIDLTQDPNGGVIKMYDGNMWNSISARKDTEVTQAITALQTGKVDKVAGKVLSTNDYTAAEKTKLSGIAANANATVVVNNLTTTTVTSALSAAQGKTLNDKIVALTARVEALEAA